MTASADVWRRRLLVASIWPVLVAGLVVVAASSATTTRPVEREVLPNGIVLLVAERPTVPVVALRIYVRGAGAAFDPPTRQGLANLTATLLQRGTRRRGAAELDAAIEFVGGRLETGVDRDGLVVAVDVLRKDLLLGLDLAAEVLLAPAFPDVELARTVKEIEAAIRRADESPDDVAARALRHLVFERHPYGWPVEGTHASVASLSRPDVVDFYQTRVRPDSTIVAVAGALSAAEARREVLARFGSWSRPERPARGLPVAVPAGPPRAETLKRELTQSTILMGRQAVSQTDPDYFALAVASYILGGGSTSRLYTRVRENGGLAYAVWSDLDPGRYGALLSIGAQTRTAATARVTEILRDELARLGRERVSDDELALAKSFLIGSFPLRLDTTAKVAGFFARVEAQQLGLDYADRYRQAVARVTALDVQRVSVRWLSPESLHRVVVGAAP